MIPILHSLGVSTPGQLGPIRRDLLPESARLTLIMSSTGMPSVMQTISGISASMASRMASAANGGGTDITLASGRVAPPPLPTGADTGRANWTVPPLPGGRPPPHVGAVGA